MTRIAALLLAPLVLLGALTSPTHADDPDLRVDFPWDQSYVNAHSDQYQIYIEDRGVGQVYAEWQGARQLLPRSGWHTMTFDKGGEGRISIVRCSGEPQECVDTGRKSPELTVVGSLESTATGIPEAVPSGAVAPIEITSPHLAGIDVAVAWTVSRGGGWSPVTGRSETLRADESGRVAFDVRFPRSTPEDDYDVSIRLEADVAPFGTRVGRHGGTVRVDSTKPRVSLKLPPEVYPIRDEYLDTVTALAEFSEQADSTVELLRGDEVIRRFTHRDKWGATQLITGRTASGGLLPAGSYTVRVTAIDPMGNTGSASRSLVISHKRLVKKTWERTISAQAAMQQSTVAPCSTLRRGSSRGWSGSLGLYSQSKCRKGADQVRVVNAIEVPDAFQFQSVRVSTYGGGATGRGGGTTASLSQLLIEDWSTAGVSRFNGKVGLHHGGWGAAFKRIDGKWLVRWRVWAEHGSRYDVKSYTVRLIYTALQ
ncbi:hypothetical protein [Nocardioides speluncae]|uniref:hypothetical protein n=1 Tax=Nocardioides speluncae TaxID=2670337 RepID=UPI0012B17B9A|nr:hypothetical protein [Nocardioides speluncae]